MVLFFQFELKMAVQAALKKKKIYEMILFVNFILMFLQEHLPSFLNMGKPFSSNLEG